MKTNYTQQEILLLTGTSFSLQEFSETTDGLNYNHLTEKEKLEVACWNGLLPVMLPEVFQQHAVNKSVHSWTSPTHTLIPRQFARKDQNLKQSALFS